jgi:hypothetical protein
MRWGGNHYEDGRFVGELSGSAGVVISVANDRKTATFWHGVSALIQLSGSAEPAEVWAQVRPGAMFSYTADYGGRPILGTLVFRAREPDQTVPAHIKQLVDKEAESDEWTLIVRRGDRGSIGQLPKVRTTPRAHMNLDGYDVESGSAPWLDSGYLSAFEYVADDKDSRETLVKALETEDLDLLSYLQLVCIRGLAAKKALLDLTDGASMMMPTSGSGLMRTENVKKTLPNQYSWIIQHEVLYFGDWLPNSVGLAVEYSLARSWLANLGKAEIIRAVQVSGEFLPHTREVSITAKPNCVMCKKGIEKNEVQPKRCSRCSYTASAHANCVFGEWKCGTCASKSWQMRY